MIYGNGSSIPKGPVVLKDGSWQAVEMGPARGCITRITDEGKKNMTMEKLGCERFLSTSFPPLAQRGLWLLRTCFEAEKGGRD